MENVWNLHLKLRELRVKWYHTVNGKFARHNLVISVRYSHLKRLYSVICHDIKLHVFQNKGFTSTSWHQQLSGQISFQMWNVLRKFEKQIKNHNTPLPSSTNPRFQNEAKCTTFLVKMSLFAWEWKIISISKLST